MCKKISIFLAFLCLLPAFALSIYAIDTTAKGAVLIEGDSAQIIYEKNAHSPLPMASTTKIMTGIVVIENCNNLDKKYKIPKDAIGTEGSSIYLKDGEELTIRELLYALLLESANDASVALAIISSGSVECFVEKMNEKACELGLLATHFENPHGLDDENHYSSAYDLAILSKYALSNPIFSEIVSTKKMTIPLNNGEGTRVLVNHNKLLRLYDGANGVKTGFTKRTGRCLVSSSKRDGVWLIAVTLNDPNDWRDHTALFDYGYELYTSVNLADKGDYLIELPLQNGKKSTVLCTNLEPLSVTLKKDDINISARLEYIRPIFAPVSKGMVLGRVVFYNNDKEIGSLDLVSTEEIKNIDYKNFFERLFTNGKD